jgi:signal transduction histidine kinase/CHASE2 domain-containing sensor protein
MGLLSGLGFLSGVERQAVDALFRARGPRNADPRVIVIAIDDAAVVRAAERTGRGWPLPRRYYTRAVQKLQSMGAKTIAFDVLFSEPGPNSAEDAELARICRAAGNIAQACAFQVSEKRAELSLGIEGRSINTRFAVANANAPRVRDAIWATAPLPTLSDGAATLGHLNVFPEVNGTLRRVPHLLRWRGQIFPSLSLAASSHFLGEKPSVAPEGTQKALISLGSRRIPIDRDGLTLVNWIGAGGSYPTFGLNQLLDGDVPEAAVRGRLIVIGVTAMGAYENRSTPFAGGVPAVDFQANAMDDILSNRILKVFSPFWAAVLTLISPIVCALLTARRGRGGFWLVPIWMLLLSGAGLFCLSRNLILPIGAPLLGGALAFAVTAAGGYRREWESRTRADASVSALARGTTLLGAATSANGRERERLLTIIRATARETLGAREVLVVFDETLAQEDPRAILATQRAQEAGVGWVWPPARVLNRTLRRRRARSTARNASKNLSGDSVMPENVILAGETLVAAPLSSPHTASEEIASQSKSLADSGDATKTRTPRQFCGALVAIGRREGGNFTARDAVLLETLAEGASLALENWHYADTMRGRIESTNRELSGAYQLLAEQSAKLFAAVESIDAALVISDANGHAAFVNPAGARVLRGATPILGEPVVSALAAGDLEELAHLFENLTPQGNPDENGSHHIQPESIRLETTRGREVLAAHFTPLVSDDQQLIGAMLVVSDVTAQRELDRMKTDFVGYVAHELRTPLTTILGYASLLDMSAGRFSPDQVREMTGVISRHCRRMNRMISDLLDISRIENGLPLSIVYGLFDLSALCERLLEEQKPYLNPTPPFELVFDGPAEPLEWAGDSDRIEQVVINLLSNAIKYSPNGGKVTLWLRAMPSWIQMEVRDQGMGLSQDQIGQLFQKFYRTGDAQERGIKGNGLGLNLVRQIVGAHGGHIEVESRRDEGEPGTTFRVFLPLKEGQKLPQLTDTTPVSLSSF